MSAEVKKFIAKDLFTFEEFKQMADIVRLSLLDGKPAAPEIAERVIKPVIARIEAKVEGIIDPMYLAYAAEESIRHFLTTDDRGMYATTVPAIPFDKQGPVN